MANVIFSIQGEAETVRKISAFDMKKQKEARVVVKKHATAVRKNARNIVPVSPSSRKKSSGKAGDLKSSIRTKYYFDGLGAMVIPNKPKGSHRHLVEYGTKDRHKKNGKFVGRNKPQPFMKPAKAAQESSYNREMKGVFEGDDTIV